MRLDHIAYRVKNRAEAVKFFCDAFGYKVQDEFEITLEDGSKAKCQSLEPSEKRADMVTCFDLHFGSTENSPEQIKTWHLAPEIFVSDGPPGSLIDEWVNTWGRGVGGIHHLAYEVDDVQKTMDEWKAKGWLFTTEAPLNCQDLTQVFSKPNPYTNIIYEFIQRRGQRGFCRDNVAKLMNSTKDLNLQTQIPTKQPKHSPEFIAQTIATHPHWQYNHEFECFTDGAHHDCLFAWAAGAPVGARLCDLCAINGDIKDPIKREGQPTAVATPAKKKRVLIIIHYEDMSLGQPTAVINIPEGMDGDECYKKWLEQNGHPEDWEAQATVWEPDDLEDSEE